jgi:hypothetical protein
MATQKTVTLYSFSELSKEVQAKLIKYYRDDESFLDFDFLERHMFREFENEAEAMGIQDFDFRYSGFWSQGDGASFTGTLTKELVVAILEHGSSSKFLHSAKDWAKFYGNKIEVSVVRHSSMYVHAHTVSCEFKYDADELEISREDYERITGYLNDWKNNLCYKFFNQLLKSYEEVTSDDHIASLLEGQEVFLCNGQTLDNSVFDEEEEGEEDYPVPYGSERNYYI